jgi:NAD(P)H-flavin reductase
MSMENGFRSQSLTSMLAKATVVIQAMGKTTFEMMSLKEGDAIVDFGPLGLSSHIHKVDGPSY